jgi:hypothetical protein
MVQRVLEAAAIVWTIMLSPLVAVAATTTSVVPQLAMSFGGTRQAIFQLYFGFFLSRWAISYPMYSHPYGKWARQSESRRAGPAVGLK